MNILVNLNFFVEKHGKNSRDTHFSCVCKFLKNESILKKLNSTQDIVDAINKGQHKSNESRKLLSKKIMIKFK